MFCNGFVAGQTDATGEKRLQRAENMCLGVAVEFRTDPFQCARNERGGPTPFVLLLFAQGDCRCFARVKRLNRINLVI